jgi:hypothetical protein
VALLLLCAAGVIQGAALYGMGPRRLIGDEVDYLGDAGEDPQASLLFLRPPLLLWIGRWCHRPGDRGEGRMRAVMGLASVLTVALTAAAGWQLGGTEAAVLAGVLLLVQPERIVFGCHLWPETLLALLVSGLNLLLVLPAGGGAWRELALGALCALGTLIRLDFLAAAPFAALGLAASGHPATFAECASIAAPSLLVVVLLSVRNRRRYGVPLPDTTWAFNLTLARSQLESRFFGLEIEPRIDTAVQSWSRLSPREHLRQGIASVGSIVTAPGAFLRGVAKRVLILVGPDTFIRQKLLQSDVYPRLHNGMRKLLAASLLFSYPLLLTVALFTWVLAGRELPSAFLFPSLGLFGVAALVHARTRYRVSILPTVSLMAAAGLFAAGEALVEPMAPLALIGAALFFWGLLHITCSAELADEPSTTAPRGEAEPAEEAASR